MDDITPIEQLIFLPNNTPKVVLSCYAQKIGGRVITDAEQQSLIELFEGILSKGGLGMSDVFYEMKLDNLRNPAMAVISYPDAGQSCIDLMSLLDECKRIVH